MPTYLKDVTFDFEEEGGFFPHISYCTPAVGGAASGLNKAILLKATGVRITPESLELMKAAKEVRVEMSFEDFLSRFFSLWGEDAAVLAKLLGFESSIDEEMDEDDSWEERRKKRLEEKVEAVSILKALHTKEKDFFSLDLKEQKDVLAIQEKFEKGLQEIEVNKGLSEGTNPSDAKVALNKKGDVDDKDTKRVGEKMTEVNKDYQDLVKSVESLQKALDAEKTAREALEKKEEQRIEKAFIEKAKEFPFVEDAEAFGKILKSLDEEVALSILGILEKAKTSVEENEQVLFKQQSASGEAEELPEGIQKRKSATRDALKKQLKIDDGE